jgi:hypothetical protein
MLTKEHITIQVLEEIKTVACWKEAAGHVYQPVASIADSTLSIPIDDVLMSPIATWSTKIVINRLKLTSNLREKPMPPQNCSNRQAHPVTLSVR